MAIQTMKGMDAVSRIIKENQERQAEYEARKASGETTFKPRVWAFWLKTGEADITILDQDPTLVLTHKVGPKFDTRACLGDGCPYCDKGSDRPKYRAYHTIVDHRERTYQNKDKVDVTVKDEIRYYELSPSQREALETSLKKSKVKDIRDVVVNVVVSGAGKGKITSFFIKKGEDVDRGSEHCIPENAEPLNFSEFFETSIEEAAAELKYS